MFALLRRLWRLLAAYVLPPDQLIFTMKGLPAMPQTILADKDTITGVRVVARRKGVVWPLPADLAVTSSDEAVVTASLDGDAITIARGGAAGGVTNIVATGGGLSASLSVAVEAAGPDELLLDDRDAVVS